MSNQIEYSWTSVCIEVYSVRAYLAQYSWPTGSSNTRDVGRKSPQCLVGEEGETHGLFGIRIHTQLSSSGYINSREPISQRSEAQHKPLNRGHLRDIGSIPYSEVSYIYSEGQKLMSFYREVSFIRRR